MKSDALSRRGFLHTAGAGTMGAWLPRTARVRDAEASLVGVSKWDLDTPALCVDLDKLEQNLATMKAKLAGTGVATRPHAKTHKCPAIAKLQLAGGLDRRLHGEGQRGGGAVRQRRRQDPDDDVERDGEQDPARDDDPQDEPQFIQAVDQPAERARLERRRQGSRRRRRRRDRRGGRHAKRRAGRRTGAGAGAAGRQAAEPEAARHASATTAARSTSRDSRRGSSETLKNFEPSVRDLRHDEARGAEHGDLQRRRHRHLQHHDEGAGVHRPAGRQLHLHGRAVPGDRRRRRTRTSTPTSSRR